MSRDPAAGPANRLPVAKAGGDGHPGSLARRPGVTRTGDRSPFAAGGVPVGPASPGTGDPERTAASGRTVDADGVADSGGRADNERPRLELTATQIGAGVAAALTSAILGSGLGVAGTVVGAGVGSAISITASALYTHSIAATRQRLRRARARTVRPRAADPAGGTGGPEHVPITPSRDGTARPPTRPIGSRRVLRGRSIVVGAMGTALVFALSLVLVTGIETVKGVPLAGGRPGGLSVLGGASADSQDAHGPARPARSTAPSTAPSTTPSTATAGTSGGIPRSSAPASPSAGPSTGAASATRGPAPSTAPGTSAARSGASTATTRATATTAPGPGTGPGSSGEPGTGATATGGVAATSGSTAPASADGGTGQPSGAPATATTGAAPATPSPLPGGATGSSASVATAGPDGDPANPAGS